MTNEEALKWARVYGLYYEVKELLDDGMDAENALREYDIYQKQMMIYEEDRKRFPRVGC